MFQGNRTVWQGVLTQHLKKFTPEDFSRGEALDIDWKPLRGGVSGEEDPPEARFRVKEGAHQLIFREFEGIHIGGILILLILLFTAAGLFTLILSKSSGAAGYIIATMAALPVAGYGVYGFIRALIAGEEMILFDLKKGIYRNSCDHYLPGGEELETPIDQIVGVQLLTSVDALTDRYGTEYHYCYELNLVLENNNRLFLGHFYQPEKAQEHGKQIAHFLTVPLWDGIVEAPSEDEVAKLKEELEEAEREAEREID